jgi:hypothetical protein
MKVTNMLSVGATSLLFLKNAVFWDVKPCDFVRTDVSEESIVSIITMTRIGELGTTLAGTSNRSTLRRDILHGHRHENLKSYIVISGFLPLD